MTPPDDLETLLAEIVAYHEEHGVLPALDAYAARRPDLAPDLLAMAHRYLALSASLDTGVVAIDVPNRAADDAGWTHTASTRAAGFGSAPPASLSMPVVDGFRTIERIGSGGMGEVYKLQDLTLDRIVAAKIVRRDRPGDRRASAAEFLREAKSLALFSDPRIVRIFECRLDLDPAVIIMEYVEGFELGRIGPSLEFRQRATLMREICDAVHHAHTVGIQHRDLKPSNIMLDGALRPKILDFGLSDGDPSRGHLRGTIAYIAPEQLNPLESIDARTDVYALGVILYELLCGAPPYRGDTQAILDAVKAGHPRLPAEVDPRVPEGLQAIALKAMERQPADRYQTARDMARDLDRWLDGRVVVARPSQYATTLTERVKPHVDQVAEWERLNLIYPHEARRLTSAYRVLEAREDDWIVASRALTPSQVALYLGAFLLFIGSLFYFVAQRVEDAIDGLFWPAIVLGLPFVGLNAAGRWLYKREQQSVAVAFYLGALSLLPLLLLIVFSETDWWIAPEDATGQFFDAGWVSNRQLQVTTGLSCLWASWLALRTRTSALGTAAIVLAMFFALGVLTDFNLRTLLEDAAYDRIALRLAPLVLAYAAAGFWLERAGRHWFARPTFAASAVTLVVVLDLLALDGKMLDYVGVTLGALQPTEVDDPVLIDTLAGLSLNGVLFFLLAGAIENRGTDTMRTAALILATIAPFSILEPLAYLCNTQTYFARYDWIYLILAIGVAVLSYRRQRKSFYYAGLANTAFALYVISARQQWFDRPAWAISIVATGLAVLILGYMLDRGRERR